MEKVENVENKEIVQNAEPAVTAKKPYGDNVAPLWRWVVAFLFGTVIGMILGAILTTIVRMIPAFHEDGWLYCESSLMLSMATFVGLFIGYALGIKIFCKTSLKTFFFGKDRKPEMKTAFKAAGFYYIGIFGVDLICFKSLSFNSQPVSVFITNLVLVLLLLWTQTTTEEIVFRGFFLRAPYGNNVPKLPKGLLFAIVSSLIFMSGHLANPEVSDISGLEFVAGTASYFFAGFFMYISNLLLGGMEGGLIIHYINNFYCLVLISEFNSAIPAPTFFVKQPEKHPGYMSLLCEFVAYGFAFAYIIYHNKKKKAAAATGE